MESGVGERKMYESDRTLLFNSPEQYNYVQDPSLKNMRHTKEVEFVIYFRRKGLPFNFMHALVCNANPAT